MDIQGARALAHTVMSGLSKSPAADSADASQAARFRMLLQSGEPGSVAGTSDAASAAGVGPEVTAVGGSGAAAATGPDAALAAEFAAVPAGPSSLGDTILRGIEKVRGGLNEGLAQTNALIDPESGPISTARLLQFQVGMLNMGFQYEMVAGVVTKTAQNIDQLVKMQ